MMRHTSKWSIQDIITTVLMSVLLIVIQFMINMICQVNNFLSMVLSTGMNMMLCGPVYCVMIGRIRKPMVSFIYLTMVVFVFFLTGNWYVLPYLMTVGLISEIILWRYDIFQHPWKIVLSWTVISLLYHGVNLLPIWFFWDTFSRFAMKSGMEREYVNAYVRYYTEPHWLIFILVFTVICGLTGAMLGIRLTRKHFVKSGVL